MKDNKLRNILGHDLPSVSTRLWTARPVFIEALGALGAYDYFEFLAEYSPFSQDDLENMARAAELSGLGSMIKVDFLGRGYVAQKAIASGFQAILFADCLNAEDVAECVHLTMPGTPQEKGRFGYPNRRFIGYQPHLAQMDHAKREIEVVRAFMIEKKSAVDDIEAICQTPGVDMVQFGPSDYSMSCGKNLKDYREEAKDAERRVISTAIKYNVAPRCEIQSPMEAEYYAELGVRHFSIGDQLPILTNAWKENAEGLNKVLKSISQAIHE